MSNGTKNELNLYDILGAMWEHDTQARDRRQVEQELKEVLAPEVVAQEKAAYEAFEKAITELAAKIMEGQEELGKATLSLKPSKPKKKRKYGK